MEMTLSQVCNKEKYTYGYFSPDPIVLVICFSFHLYSPQKVVHNKAIFKDSCSIHTKGGNMGGGGDFLRSF